MFPNSILSRDYIDDLIIGSTTFEEHLKDLDTMLNSLQNAKLQVKLSKCKFGRTKVNFLGHTVSKEGVKPNIEKVEAIMKMQPPIEIQGLQQFLGMTSYYRQFIKDYAKIAEPLNRLLKTGSIFKWDQHCQQAFETLKERLMTAPILVFPDFRKPFKLITDASDFALGAVLAQKNDKNQEQVISYASRTLQPPERKYTVTEKEALAVVWSTGLFCPYIYGYHFRVHTDHKALEFMDSIKNLEGRLGRWSMTLSELDMEIVARPGKANQSADALSRIDEANIIQIVNTPVNEIIQQKQYNLRKAQMLEPKLAAIINYLSQQILPDDDKQANWTLKVAPYYELVDQILYRKANTFRYARRQERKLRIVLPQALRSIVLEECHDTSASGHLGIKRTLA